MDIKQEQARILKLYDVERKLKQKVIHCRRSG